MLLLLLLMLLGAVLVLRMLCLRHAPEKGYIRTRMSFGQLYHSHDFANLLLHSLGLQESRGTEVGGSLAGRLNVIQAGCCR